ncbi:hypothetical protein CPC735_040370 [Coccidioides posadasii C735 delta SOWgp]|uniref:Uncharacterized protein n=1 Tax=Coccidioides posadasii (strain C735) TaxID=222929 RepID=C5P385_COCP7|nr:hypothetical protein CPC735_040370 [Coccidioides posadasii C735 delta SOWgp]EER28773.1 hypothetical protein CPC735_040370 [Coccidioides posadasii C735 delta SOWgp]|eukprot:XP_003070918.1 hypothetical protein CPC735_040370 [Coccidioides posadasii C735 delta SOWgp]
MVSRSKLVHPTSRICASRWRGIEWRSYGTDGTVGQPRSCEYILPAEVGGDIGSKLINYLIREQ